MSSSGAPSTTNAGTSGAPSSAWQPSWSPRARSFGSASTIRPRKKPVRHIEGLARYRNGAGSARQEYRTLRGVNFVLGIMHIPLTALARPQPQRPGWPRTLSQSTASPQPSTCRIVPAVSWPVTILDFVAEQLPGRPIRSLADGGYATKDYVRQLPKAAHVVGRFPISAKLYELPPTPTPKRRGAPRKKGDLIGSPKTLAQTATGWSPHPSEAGAEIQAW